MQQGRVSYLIIKSVEGILAEVYSPIIQKQENNFRILWFNKTNKFQANSKQYNSELMSLLIYKKFLKAYPCR